MAHLARAAIARRIQKPRVFVADIPSRDGIHLANLSIEHSNAVDRGYEGPISAIGMRDEHAIESGRSQPRPNSSNLAHLLDTVAVKELLLIGDDNIVYAVEQLNERTHRGSTQPRYLRIGTFGADAAQKHRRHHDVSEGGKS